MGLRLEIYNENFVGLVVDFTHDKNTEDFCVSNSVDEAIIYFDLYLDTKTNRLKRNDPNQKIVDQLAIDINSIGDFQEQLGTIVNKLTDDDALQYTLLFEEWNQTKQYSAGDRVRYDGTLYKCLQSHTAQNDWTPDAAVSLWAKVLTSDTPQEWVQPDSTNPYMKGDQVIFEGNTYESLIDNNVWSPSAYPAGWKLIS